jgi:protein SCO1
VKRGRRAALALLACLAWAPAAAADEADMPRAGTYTLHRIMAAPDGEVVGVDGRSARLSRYTRGRITLLGFIYTTCTDPEGCPLAYRVFDTVRQAVATTPSLRGAVRIVTLSFDPLRDTPDVMARYAGSRVREEGGAPPWYFLTTRSARALAPLVAGFGQDIRYTIDRSTGKPRRELSHVLKVFLIDPAGFVREIYTSTFLEPRTVLTDIETLRMDAAASRPQQTTRGRPGHASPVTDERRRATAADTAKGP